MIDIFVLEFMNSISNPLFDNVMPFITKLGDKGLIWILLALIMLYYKQTRTYGIAIIMASVSYTHLTLPTKRIV